MDQYKNIRNKKDYDSLKGSGMFWEFHPELTGDWEKDQEIMGASEIETPEAVVAAMISSGKFPWINSRRSQLLACMIAMHGDQKRKYTNDPFYIHPIGVAHIVANVIPNDELLVEVAICHDLIEDTECTLGKLKLILLGCGYSEHETVDIAYVVDEVTNVFTKEANPDLNRIDRKRLERERLETTSLRAHAIKMADCINNTIDLAEQDPKFAEVYLAEKGKLICLLSPKASPKLHKAALLIIEEQTIILANSKGESPVSNLTPEQIMEQLEQNVATTEEVFNQSCDLYNQATKDAEAFAKAMAAGGEVKEKALADFRKRFK